MASIPEIDAPTAQAMLAAGKAVLIDVREADEFARERIPGARLVPLSTFDPGAIPAGAVILQCRVGRRSMDAAQRLAATGRTELFNLRGGIDAWRRAGLALEVPRSGQ
jgi:rhodanese-related sulfurtransferase